MNGIVNAAASIPLPTVSAIYDNMSDIYSAGVTPPPDTTDVPDLPDLTDYIDLATLGVTGNGNDEYSVLNPLLSTGGKYILDGLNVRIDSQVTSTGPLYLVGLNGAKIYSGNSLSTFSHALIEAKEYISCYGLELDGNDTMEQGIIFEKSCYIVNNHIHNFSTNENSISVGVYSAATGVQGNPGAGTFSQYVNWNNIHDITGYWFLRTDGTVQVGDSRGASRAVMIRNNSDVTTLDVQVNHNTFNNIFGEEGDDVFIFDHDFGTRTSSYEVAYNTMLNVHRRAVKYACYDPKIHHNTISSLNYPNQWIVLSDIERNSWNITAPISCSVTGYAGAEIYENTIDYTSIANAFFNTVDHDDIYIHDNHLKFRKQSGTPGEPALILFDGTPSGARIENNDLDSDAQYIGARTYSGSNASAAVISGNTFVIHSADQTFYYPGVSLPNATLSGNLAIDPNGLYAGGAPLTVQVVVDPPVENDLLYSSYQKDIGVMPLYDSSNSDHQLISSPAQLGLLNTSSAHYFYLIPGVNYKANGRFTITTSGSATSRKYILLNDGLTTHPAKLVESAQANIEIYFNGASYWTLHRLSAMHTTNYTYGGDTRASFMFDNGATDNILSALNLSDLSNPVRILTGNHRNSIQHCAIHDQQLLARKADIPGIALIRHTVSELSGSTLSTVIVGNEIHNTNDGIQLVTGGSDSTFDYGGTIIDSNNIWVSPDMYVGLYDMYGENGIDLKSASQDASMPVIITNNHIWGMRNNLGHSGPGTGVVGHHNVKYMQLEDNVIFDCDRVLAVDSGWYNSTLKRNILVEGDKSEGTVYNALIYNFSGAVVEDNIIGNISSGYGFAFLNGTGLSFNRNICIDAVTIDGAPESTTSANNHYYNTSHPSLDGIDYTIDPIMDDYTFQYDVYRYQTPPSKTVSGVVTTASSPHSISS